MTVRFCQHCGAAQLENSVFCERCGERLSPKEPPPTLAEITARAQTRELPRQPPEPVPKVKPRHPVWLLAVIIGLVGMGCLSLIALGFFLISILFPI